MSAARTRDRGGDPWIIAEARKLGFESDPESITIACAGWPLAFLGLPWLWLTYARILIVGPQRAALFKADAGRQDPKRLVWSGNTADVRMRTVLRRLLRGDTPVGHRFYVDAPSEARRLSDFLSHRPNA